MSAPTVRVLERAAEIIEERGWCRGTWEDPHGHVCAWGAIAIASDELGGGEVDAKTAVEDAVESSLSQWNDEQYDKRLVTRVLRRVARTIAQAEFSESPEAGNG